MNSVILEDHSSCLDASESTTTAHPCRNRRATDRLPAPKPALADGRYIVNILAGQLRDSTPAPAVACLIDPTDAVQVLTFLRECCTASVLDTVSEYLGVLVAA